MFIIFIVWCTIEATSNNGKMKEYCVNSKYLETETGDPVGMKDLFFENTILWKCKGVPYKATVLETHRKFT